MRWKFAFSPRITNLLRLERRIASCCDSSHTFRNAAEAEPAAIKGRSLLVGRTNRQYLKVLNFPMHGREFLAIEQNAAKPSYWGELARKGHQVVQFKDLSTDRYVAVAVDGVVQKYSDMGKHCTKKIA